MNANAPWNDLWEDARPSVELAKRTLAKARAPSARTLRVSQLDAELLDQELTHLLQEPLTKALGDIRLSLKTRYAPELTLAIQLLLYRLSVWASGASYGDRLQDLRYKKSVQTSTGLSRRTLALHAALTILAPYVHSRARQYALSHAWPDAPTSSKRRRAWELFSKGEVAYGALVLGAFVAFLYEGRYRSLSDRILGLQLVPATRITRREVSYEFMNRQMVWHSFTEFLLFVLPLLPRHTLRRAASLVTSTATYPINAFSNFFAPDGGKRTTENSISSSEERKGPLWHLPENECAICYENATDLLSTNSINSLVQPRSPQAAENADEIPSHPIHIPYYTTCGHVYCYVCIADKVLCTADGHEGWACLRCTEVVRGVDRVSEPTTWASDEEGDDERSAFEYGSDYFDELGSTMSGISGVSVGSHIWSEEYRSE